MDGLNVWKISMRAIHFNVFNTTTQLQTYFTGHVLSYSSLMMKPFRLRFVKMETTFVSLGV